MKDSMEYGAAVAQLPSKLDKKGSVRVYLSRQMFLDPARIFGRPSLVYFSAGMRKY
jgi:hypothetical protein